MHSGKGEAGGWPQRGFIGQNQATFLPTDPPMTLRPSLLALALALAPLPLLAAEPAPWRSAAQIIEASPASDWRTPDPDNLLYMELPGGRVVIELAPQFAPRHVANIRALANAGFWNGTSVYRVQDNFVAQFGDAEADDPAKARALGDAGKPLPAEFEVASNSVTFTALPDKDGWSSEAGFVDGFPAARDAKTGTTWLAHCYGMLGAGRNNDADSSLGAELYAVIGQAPRQLDRNMTTVGRVLQGIELLSALPRGPEPMGMYGKAEQRLPIIRIALASALPEAERLPLQVLRTESATFAQATEARRNRRDPFYKLPAGHIDLCNVPLPVRVSK
jgi:peptidylprolyl isomerase